MPRTRCFICIQTFENRDACAPRSTGDFSASCKLEVLGGLDGLATRHGTDAAALVVDNRTGDVLAYVGSPNYWSDSLLGRNDGVQALRQPGSALKPFTYELALERGTIASTTILPDVPSSFSLPGGKLYTPSNT